MANRFKQTKKMPTGRRFKPGQSGNPKGRPKKDKCIPDLLRKIGEFQAPEELYDRVIEYFELPKDATLTMAEAVCMVVYMKALEGQSWAINFIVDRTEGKPAQTIIQTDSNKPDFTKVEFVRFKQ
ncbi:MAG: hypothetical protein HOB17_12390 [Candidatus Marinimicrobia bacterium]|mgnify:FL=1|jgi:hypothetical protein|nr:hypothetical protein [Bacteroidota bacterium]MBT5530354.1 hypothetical protein [Cytophagia bacterium]MBT6714707.1 hypothetical protein [Candidatus Neomarinimicrobiota bacterium]